MVQGLPIKLFSLSPSPSFPSLYLSLSLSLSLSARTGMLFSPAFSLLQPRPSASSSLAMFHLHVCSAGSTVMAVLRTYSSLVEGRASESELVVNSQATRAPWAYKLP